MYFTYLTLLFIEVNTPREYTVVTLTNLRPRNLLEQRFHNRMSFTSTHRLQGLISSCYMLNKPLVK